MSVPVEPVEVINRRLLDWFGHLNDLPNYRIVWSDDQYEKRETYFTPEGFGLLYAEVRELPKYAQYVQQRWILERLTVVPEFQRSELADQKLSYEPIWVFEDPRTAQALPPNWAAAKFVVETIHKNIEEAGCYTKYKHPDAGLTAEEINERKRKELMEIENALFANETNVGDALAHKYGVVNKWERGEEK